MHGGRSEMVLARDTVAHNTRRVWPSYGSVRCQVWGWCVARNLACVLAQKFLRIERRAFLHLRVVGCRLTTVVFAGLFVEYECFRAMAYCPPWRVGVSFPAKRLVLLLSVACDSIWLHKASRPTAP